MIFPDAPNSPEAAELQLIRRRGVLSTLGLAGLGVIASATPAAAFTAKKKGASIPKVSVPTSSSNSANRSVPFTPAAATPADLPEEWAIRNASMANDYYRYLNTLGLQRLNPRQVIQAHAKLKGTVWNSLPPKVWWKRMGYTLRVVERIAKEMNVSDVEVISAYRAPAYNARCAGARAGSWHQANIALDVKFPARASKVAATARELRDLGLFKGGVGGYWNFTHIDCRGQNINW